MINVEEAMKTARVILDAVLKRVPNMGGSVRRYADENSPGVIEIALKDINSQRQEISVAYADEFFLPDDKEVLKTRARQVYDELLAALKQ